MEYEMLEKKKKTQNRHEQILSLNNIQFNGLKVKVLLDIY